MGTPAESSAPLTAPQGALLARLAVGSVRSRLVGEQAAELAPEPEPLRSPGASFVTLERRGRLRGCVGTLQATRPLYLDVIRNARRAMADPRLPPVDRTDWPELDVKVSVLTAPAPLGTSGLDELLAALRPGVDGVLFTDGSRRATFLPAVWHRLTEPAEFVAALLQKGGWHAGEWPDGLAVHRYQAYEYHDPAPRNPLPGG
ncbi:MAG: AmmeMemoRadiSam system protein A [Micromonosporaceae bacterium]